MNFNIQRTHGIIHIGQKKQAGLATGLLQKKNKLLRSSRAVFAQGTDGTDAKRQQHQGTCHNR